MPSKPVLISFCVHLFTASGIVLALLALILLIQGDLDWMWICLGAALIVDGLDGPLARKFDVKQHLPQWSGETLDMVIDYITYAFIPAFVIYQQGWFQQWLDGWLTLALSALIVITSIFYPAKSSYMSKQNFFIGFPICWNMVVFVLFVLEPNAWVSLAAIVLSLSLTFTPLLFVHPVRVPTLRNLNIAVSVVWGICSITAMCYSLYGAAMPDLVKLIMVVTSLYLYFVGIVLQLLGRAE